MPDKTNEQNPFSWFLSRIRGGVKNSMVTKTTTYGSLGGQLQTEKTQDNSLVTEVRYLQEKQKLESEMIQVKNKVECIFQLLGDINKENRKETWAVIQYQEKDPKEILTKEKLHKKLFPNSPILSKKEELAIQIYQQKDSKEKLTDEQIHKKLFPESSTLDEQLDKALDMRTSYTEACKAQNNLQNSINDLVLLIRDLRRNRSPEQTQDEITQIIQEGISSSATGVPGFRR